MNNIDLPFSERTHRVQALIMKDNTFLMLEHQYQDQTFWALPGGGIEKGETFEQALIREIKEETLLDISIKRRLFSEDVSDLPPYFYKIIHTYLVDIIGGNLSLGCEPETQGFAGEFDIISLKWFSFERIPDNIGIITKNEIKRLYDLYKKGEI